MINSRYASTWVLGLLLVFQVSKTFAGTGVPVLLWGGDAPSMGDNLSDPFKTTTQSEFESVIDKFVGSSLTPVLVFVKDSLCATDLKQAKDSLIPVTEVDSWVYYSHVVAPISVFENLPYYNFTKEEKPESISEGQVTVINVTKLNDVVKTFNKMRESSPKVVAALTGLTCQHGSLNRIKRAATTEGPSPAPSSEFNILTDRILFHASAAPNLTFTGDKNVTATYENVNQEGNGSPDSPLTLNFEYAVSGSETYKANILLQFPVTTAGYYEPKVLYKRDDSNVTLKTSIDLSFPFNFSYHCSQTVAFRNSTNLRFDLTDFQVQIDATNFNDAYDCIGFTTIPIWAGIFVTSILALIMIGGLTMIMDIRTPDRYDDPKGKTISISATAE